jgi:hypothetical protein
MSPLAFELNLIQTGPEPQDHCQGSRGGSSTPGYTPGYRLQILQAASPDCASERRWNNFERCREYLKATAITWPWLSQDMALAVVYVFYWAFQGPQEHRRRHVTSKTAEPQYLLTVVEFVPGNLDVTGEN